MREEKKGFPYDPAPDVNRFPFPDAPFADPVFGQPESCADLVNKYGTYNIQPTADTDNLFPLIAPGLPRRGRGMKRDKGDLEQLP